MFSKDPHYLRDQKGGVLALNILLCPLTGKVNGTSDSFFKT